MVAFNTLIVVVVVATLSQVASTEKQEAGKVADTTVGVAKYMGYAGQGLGYGVIPEYSTSQPASGRLYQGLVPSYYNPYPYGDPRYYDTSYYPQYPAYPRPYPVQWYPQYPQQVYPQGYPQQWYPQQGYLQLGFPAREEQMSGSATAQPDSSGKPASRYF